MRNLTVHEAFLAAAAANPDRTALRFEEQSISYGELRREVARASSTLRGPLGLERGDRVGVLLSNSPEFVVMALAVAHAGMVLVPIPVGSTPRELMHIAENSGLRAVCTESRVVKTLGEALAVFAEGGISVTAHDRPFEGRRAFAELMTDADAGAAPEVVDEAAPFFFGYTSGTTGRPKAAVVSHRARTTLMAVIGAVYGCYRPTDTVLVTTPLYHGAGLTRGLVPLLFGAEVLLRRRFEPGDVARQLADPSVTATFVVPTMLDAIFDLPAAERPRRVEGALTILSNASALPERLKELVVEQWPSARLFEIYGSTEGGTVASLRPEDMSRKVRCVGQPLPFTDVKILDDDGAPVAAGEVGELVSASPFVFDGYHRDPDATAAASRSVGYVGVGDLGRVDEEGYVYIVGRRSDLIISGGVNVYPREVEEVLGAHPAVRESVVVGVDDEHWGEVVHAVVVTRDGWSLTPDALRSHCRALLASPKVPKTTEFRTALPRTPSGKVVRRDLRPAGRD